MKLFGFRLKSYAPGRGRNRQPGECDSLKNTTPMRVDDSEMTRYGYSSSVLVLPSVGGTQVTMDAVRYVSTENPSARELLVLFSHIGSNQYIHLDAIVSNGSSSWQSGWYLLTETLTGITVSSVGSKTFVGSGSGLSTTDDYYNGWVAVNSNSSKTAALIADYNGSTNTFTTIEVLNTGTPWANGDTITLYRFFHDNVGFTPSFSSDASGRAITVLEKNGAIRINTGRGSATSRKPLWIGYINRTFFPGSDAFSFQGTYVSEREIKAPDSATEGIVKDAAPAAVSVPSGSTQLDAGNYWLAYCVIYDGYQRSPLVECGSVEITGLTARAIQFQVRAYPARLNKRITAVELYVAKDPYKASASKRINPYYRYAVMSLVNSQDTTDYWDWNFTYFVSDATATTLTKEKFDARSGETWEALSGYVSGVDTTYSADIEVTTPSRQFLARTYRYTDGREDLDSIYTNPMNAEGLIQPDIFPDEVDVYRHQILYGDNSTITGLAANDAGNLVVMKDRGLVYASVLTNPDGTTLLDTRIISDQIGNSSISGYVNTPFGVFFVATEAIFALTNGGLQSLTVRDWNEVYRAISSSDKQASIAWFNTHEQAVFFKLGSAVYAYYFKTQDWREVSYAHSLSGLARKSDGTIVWWSSSGALYVFDTSTTDAGTAIQCSFDTGYFVVSTDESIRVSRCFINRNQAQESGSLTCSLDFGYEGSVSTETRSSLSLSSRRLLVGISPSTRSWCDELRLRYNTSGGASGTVEFGEIEIHGTKVQKKRAA